ncbi:GtrA family protein [Velocimicrobium porci]|uniref:GtrA family protein n=1 Tax=Velocimicrobium porci TaxID=2606634 RepID=A0A6L5Y0W0_9FIRM|nr:GtrA family protein [Velocimicrobium porci]MSS64509.1 GtrA family protein [Velocimicrobium porci]
MNQKRNKIQKKELLKFLIGGGSAVVVDYISYNVFLLTGWNVSMAKAVSYVCGAIVGFIINKLWTFESKEFSKTEIVRYIILYAVSACINAGVNKLVIIVLNMKILAFLCATGISTVLNFLGQKFFVFVKKERV